MSASYDDIISLPHPTSAKHPRMPMIDRAAQFSPFQALTGYSAAIQETARLTDQRVELTEEEKSLLDEKLHLMLDTGEVGKFTYFQSDVKKSGGTYVVTEGALKKVDTLEGHIILADGMIIPIENLLEIELRSKVICSWSKSSV